MKVYGAEICIHCRNFKHIKESRGLDLNFVDITESTTNLKEFLSLRDSREEFISVKGEGRIGIPCFYMDEQISFDINEAFSWIGQPPVREEEIVEKRD